MSFEEDLKKKFLCPLPWIQLCTHTDGTQKVCCHTNFPHQIKNSKDEAAKFQNSIDMLDPLNNPGLIEIRKKMIEGEIPLMCKTCSNEELKTTKSPRIEMLQKFKQDFQKSFEKTNKAGQIEEAQVKYLDFSIGNECNLACRMCNPYYSSKIEQEWRDEGVQFNWEKVDEAHSFSRLQKVFPKSLEKIDLLCFQGGEPLINKAHQEILEFLVSKNLAANIKIEYNTNLSVLPQNLLKIWEHFKSVKLFVSLDGVEELQEIIRRPLSWEKFKTNLEKVKSLSNIEVTFVTVVQAYNVPYLIEIFEFISNYYERNELPDFIYLQEPHYLDAEALDSEQLNNSLAKIKKYLSNKQSEEKGAELINYLESLTPNKEKKMIFTIFNKKADKNSIKKWSEFSLSKRNGE